MLANETLARLKSELQEYYNNTSKGGKDRARNMQWLKEDIKKLEQKAETAKPTTTAIISLPKYYTETPERLQLLARNMADQYRGLKDPEAKRMKAIYLDIAGAPEYFLKNNLIKAI